MNTEKEKLIRKLAEAFDAKIEKVYEGALEGFAYYFSKLDVKGIDGLLNDNNKYDGVSKTHYLNLIEETFKKLKSQGITSLLAVPGKCNNCIKDCNGFTFINKKYGVYIDIIVEVKNNEISNFMECHELNNETAVTNKIERIRILPSVDIDPFTDLPF